MGTLIITLSGPGYKKEFSFEVRSMPCPTIRLLGIPNMDGVIDARRSYGIAPEHIPADIDLGFQIDSFTVEIQDSTRSSVHINQGNCWDDKHNVAGIVWKI